MRYIAAYLLAVLGGNESPSAADVTKIISSVGVEVDAERLAKVISELEGKDVNKIIAAGSKKLAKFGGGAAPAAAAGAAAAGGAAEAVVEEKEEEEEADLGAGMDMFGGGADY
uniref:60S acidic ribosomal protein P2 n=1 Tax=Globisporangium ultimum (strain ATCC 200006 / CBS 805.95 / DAOM BR144) TaxID=431595 RepID=K3WA32_GLOUD